MQFRGCGVVLVVPSLTAFRLISLLLSSFVNRFHNIIEEDDIGRVWECVENAIHQMAEEHDDDDDDDDNEEEFEYETSGVYI